MDYPCAVPVWRNPLLKGCEFVSLELESVVIGMSWCVASAWKRGGAQLTSIEDRTKWNHEKRRFGRLGASLWRIPAARHPDGGAQQQTWLGL